MVAVAEAILALLGILSAIGLIFTSAGRKNLSHFLTNLIGGALEIAVPLLSELEGDLTPIAQAFTDSIHAHGGGLLNIFRDPAAAVARDAFTNTEKAMMDLVSRLPEDSPLAAATAIGNAFGFGIGSAGVTAAFESVFPEKLNTLNAAGPILSRMAGFDEVAKHALDPLYENAFGKNLEYHYKSIFKPELPSEKDAVQWHSRRLLDDAALRTIFKYSGLKPEYEDAFVKSAYRNAQPFQLLRGLGVLNVDRAAAVDAMQFAGLRDQDIDQLIAAGERQGRQSLLNAVLAQVIRMGAEGLMDQPEIDAQLDSMDLTTEAKSLVNQHIGMARLEKLATTHKRELDEAAKGNLITTDEYRAGLAAIGYQQTEIDIYAGTIDVHNQVRILNEQAREQAAEARRTQERSVSASLLEYKRGKIDATALTGALLAIGLSPELAAAYVAGATIGTAPIVKYGSVNSPFQQQQLANAAGIKATIENYKKGHTNSIVAILNLEHFGMSKAQAEETIAYLDALASKKTPPAA